MISKKLSELFKELRNEVELEREATEYEVREYAKIRVLNVTKDLVDKLFDEGLL